MKQFLLLTILFITIAGKAEEYKNFYTGTVLPTPQKVSYSNEYLEIPLDRSMPSVCILTSSSTKLTLKELVNLFGYFPKGLPVINDFADAAKYNVIIKITSLNLSKKPEAYSIKFSKLNTKNIIEIACNDPQGLYWSIQSLKQLTFKANQLLKIRKTEIYDYPDFNIRIALGAPDKCFDNNFSVFYDYTKNLMKYKFNRYYIGGRRYMHDFAGISRSIPYNEASRIFWRKKSPEKSLKQLQTAITWFKKRGLALVPIVNPAWDSDWKNPEISRKLHISSAAQMDLLTKFLKQFTGIGCNEISLWLDDASLPLPVADKKLFGDEGKAHAYLVNKLYSALKKISPSLEMTFCQAPYFTDCNEDARVKGWGDYKRYWQYMKNNVPSEIPFFWNGRHVCSYKVTNDEADYMSLILDKKLIFLDFGWLGGHADSGYHFDQLPVKKRLPDNFYKHVLGYARPFQAKPVNEIFFAQIADYMWNPKAFDPQKSLKTAISKILGPELLKTAKKWNKVVKVIDSFGLRVTPGAVKRISKVISAYNELQQLLNEFSAKTTRKDIVNDLREYTNSIDKYIKRLKQAKFPHIERRRKKLIKIIEKENKISFRDIILTSMDFTGGARSGVYSYKCKPRYAIWAYAPEAVATMQVEFNLPGSFKDADLVICGQDDDREARCAIQIKINGNSIFKGENPFNRFGWYKKTFSIPHKYLKKGKNEITIENIEQSDNMTGPPFIMISYAVLKLR